MKEKKTAVWLFYVPRFIQIKILIYDLTLRHFEM